MGERKELPSPIIEDVDSEISESRGAEGQTSRPSMNSLNNRDLSLFIKRYYALKGIKGDRPVRRVGKWR